ncbi:hypothetical protein C7974DRAFT_386432 [Boeremia exigua]|uniref:uncharacterized protein n=1 Tax=Boeremia exigua TaxID=749465 RepID=UPI001E8D2CCC|nr:uncharacterized protein C7974DRAFT_386432 [Boeremia exigua]KAH6642938.1 hypothetical protein C7974DRAFT_386432 [Boeremia exigua]
MLVARYRNITQTHHTTHRLLTHRSHRPPHKAPTPNAHPTSQQGRLTTHRPLNIHLRTHRGAGRSTARPRDLPCATFTICRTFAGRHGGISRSATSAVSSAVEGSQRVSVSGRSSGGGSGELGVSFSVTAQEGLFRTGEVVVRRARCGGVGGGLGFVWRGKVMVARLVSSDGTGMRNQDRALCVPQDGLWCNAGLVPPDGRKCKADLC